MVVASFLEMNNTYPSVASVALGLRFGHGGPSPRRRVLFLFATVIGQSKSKRHKKKRQPSLHRLLLAVAFNHFN